MAVVPSAFRFRARGMISLSRTVAEIKSCINSPLHNGVLKLVNSLAEKPTVIALAQCTINGSREDLILISECVCERIHTVYECAFPISPPVIYQLQY